MGERVCNLVGPERGDEGAATLDDRKRFIGTIVRFVVERPRERNRRVDDEASAQRRPSSMDARIEARGTTIRFPRSQLAASAADPNRVSSGGMGTSRAAGFPRRTISIVSPEATASRSSDNLFLASYVLICRMHHASQLASQMSRSGAHGGSNPRFLRASQPKPSAFATRERVRASSLFRVSPLRCTATWNEPDLPRNSRSRGRRAVGPSPHRMRCNVASFTAAARRLELTAAVPNHFCNFFGG